MAKCVGIEPCTIAMDLEGTDGRERGEVKCGVWIFLIIFYPISTHKFLPWVCTCNMHCNEWVNMK